MILYDQDNRDSYTQTLECDSCFSVIGYITDSDDGKDWYIGHHLVICHKCYFALPETEKEKLR